MVNTAIWPCASGVSAFEVLVIESLPLISSATNHAQPEPNWVVAAVVNSSANFSYEPNSSHEYEQRNPESICGKHWLMTFAIQKHPDNGAQKGQAPTRHRVIPTTMTSLARVVTSSSRRFASTGRKSFSTLLPLEEEYPVPPKTGTINNIIIETKMVLQ